MVSSMALPAGCVIQALKGKSVFLMVLLRLGE
jgi:hypothetical protein